jgi:hypothetical protein
MRESGDIFVMQKKIIIGGVLLLVLVVAFRQFKDRVVVADSVINIDSGSHHIEGSLEAESTYQLIMKDEGVSIGTYSGDAFITALPLKTAEQLRSQYGDFFKCNAPGAIQAMQNMRGVVLIADNRQTRAAISEALTLVRAKRIPAVSFRGSHIQVRNHTTMKMNVADNTGTLLYYVSEFQILRADYLE